MEGSMMLRTLVVLSSLAWYSVAAVGAEAKSADLAEADASNKAFVLLSTSAAKTSLAASTVLRLQRITMKGDKEKFKHVDGFFVDNPFVKSHVPTEHMNVHWRALEPGDYMLDEVLQNPMGCLLKITRFRFSVAAGQTLYLGDFRAENGELSVRDRYDRDYQYFVSHAGGTRPAAFSPAMPERVVKNNPRCY
jgi:hypothetical protein